MYVSLLRGSSQSIFGTWLSVDELTVQYANTVYAAGSDNPQMFLWHMFKDVFISN